MNILNQLDDKFENPALQDLMIQGIAESILTDEVYQNYLLNKCDLYFKTINFLNDALALYERKEKYEICTLLLDFKNKIIERATEKLN